MTFSVNGVLLFNTVPAWLRLGREYIQQTDQPHIDLAQVEQSDSSAVALLLAWLRYAKSTGKSIQFHNVPQQLLAVAKVCGVLLFIS